MCETCTGRVTRRTFVLGAGAVAATTIFPRHADAAALVAMVDKVNVAPGLDISPRDAWGAGLEPKGPIVAEDVRFLLVHHTASDTQHTREAVPRILQGVYRFHTGPSKGWPDVCYEFFIDRYGGVWEGRAGSLAGPVRADATGGSQGFAQLVCLLGDFTSVNPTDEAVDALVRTLSWLADRYDIATTAGATATFTSRGSNRWPAGATVKAATISGHRDMSQTACPGDTFYPYVHTQLMADVDDRRAATAPSATAVATTTTHPATTVAPATTAASTTTAAPSTTVAPTTTASTSTTATRTAATTASAPSAPHADRTVPLTAGAAVVAVGAGAAAIVITRHRQDHKPTGAA